MCVPCAVSGAGPGIRSRRAGTELTDSPPGTEEGPDDVTSARGMSIVSTADGRRSLRRTNHVGVPAWAVSTSGQMLEKDRQNYHFSHFSAPPARLPGAGARSASRSMRGRSDLSWGLLGAQDPSCV